MVYDKKRSGDPDYDDKVPMADQAAMVVTAGDGQPVVMTKANGPVSPMGEHVNLNDPTGEELDNRPAPGEVATEASHVQTYSAEDVPTADNSLGEVRDQAHAEELVAAAEKPAAEKRASAGRSGARAADGRVPSKSTDK